MPLPRGRPWAAQPAAQALRAPRTKKQGKGGNTGAAVLVTELRLRTKSNVNSSLDALNQDEEICNAL
jgi:hypothetical protein